MRGSSFLESPCFVVLKGNQRENGTPCLGGPTKKALYLCVLKGTPLKWLRLPFGLFSFHPKKSEPKQKTQKPKKSLQPSPLPSKSSPELAQPGDASPGPLLLFGETRHFFRCSSRCALRPSPTTVRMDYLTTRDPRNSGMNHLLLSRC